jgi:hypothetical protein
MSDLGLMSKDDAEYEDVASDQTTSCEHCTHYHPSDKSCDIVEGEIAPEAWCKYFKVAQELSENKRKRPAPLSPAPLKSIGIIPDTSGPAPGVGGK